MLSIINAISYLSMLCIICPLYTPRPLYYTHYTMPPLLYYAHSKTGQKLNSNHMIVLVPDTGRALFIIIIIKARDTENRFVIHNYLVVCALIKKKTWAFRK